MDFRKGGYQPGVAFIGADHQRAGFGNRVIGSGDAHISGEYFSRSSLRATFTSALNIGGLLHLGFLAEEVGDLFLGQVQGWHDHMRRRLMGELNDPFAEIGLHLPECHAWQDACSGGSPQSPWTLT